MGEGIEIVNEPDWKTRSILREWWHGVLRQHHQFKCFAFFLILPGDTAAFDYLLNYGRELDLLSGSECLILIQTRSEIGIDTFSYLKLLPLLVESMSEGYSIRTARYFGIGFDVFPCIVLFENIRSHDYVVKSLKGMDVQEIMLQMRILFTTLQHAIELREKPIDYLLKQNTVTKPDRMDEWVSASPQEAEPQTFESAVEAVLRP